MSKFANLVIYATRRSLRRPPSLISEGNFSFKYHPYCCVVLCVFLTHTLFLHLELKLLCSLWLSSVEEPVGGRTKAS